jgi:hypothetical protein
MFTALFQKGDGRGNEQAQTPPPVGRPHLGNSGVCRPPAAESKPWQNKTRTIFCRHEGTLHN